MLNIHLSAAFREACPAFVGGLVTARVTNGPTSPELWEEIEACGRSLRGQYTTASIKDRPGIAATRLAYKRAGKDPSRYRPACEQLARRLLQGKGLYSVDRLVDAVNLVSLAYGYSTAALDADKIVGTAVDLDLGQETEPYEAIGRGVINIAHLPVYRDREGAFASPTSDSVRTRILPETRNIAVLINGYDGNADAVAEAARFTLRLLQHYCEGTDGTWTLYGGTGGESA